MPYIHVYSFTMLICTWYAEEMSLPTKLVGFAPATESPLPRTGGTEAVETRSM